MTARKRNPTRNAAGGTDRLYGKDLRDKKLRDKDLRGKVVVITGASAGVGRATARLAARQGAKVGLLARDAEALESTRAEIEAAGGEAAIVPVDVSDAEALFAAADECAAQLGPIDVWINNAMATVFAPLEDMTPEEVRRVTEVTYLGYVHGTMAALRHMRPRDRGTIVQVGSALAYRGIPLQSAYCGAKHAIRGFTDSVRAELLHAGSKVRITAVHLPAVNTTQFDWARTHMPKAPRPVAPVYTAQTAAGAIVGAACHPTREYWLGGSTAMVILANKLFPGLLDRYLAAGAVDGQQRPAAVEPGRPDNLFKPVTGLHRSDGPFGREARSVTFTVGGQTARSTALAGACIVAGLAGAMLGSRLISQRRR